MNIVLWIGFIFFIVVMLAIDLGLLHRKSEVINAKAAMRWTLFCCFLAIAFNYFIFLLYSGYFPALTPASNLDGKTAAMQFFTAWLVEQSLSLDNIFVIAIIFTFFKVPQALQHRVLFWGIMGALIMRGLMIALGAALIASFSWINYLFGALLMYAAAKILFVKGDSIDPTQNILFRAAKSIFPVSPDFDGQKFFTHLNNGKLAITPLFLVLLVIESTDVLFAVDSIPAVFAITQDPFLVFTSNIFAILNLRSLYFALAVLMDKFSLLKYALVVILFFVAIKLFISQHFHMPIEITFGVIVGALTLAILGSLNLKGTAKL